MRVQNLFFLMLLLVQGCASTSYKPTPEEIAQEELRIQNIIASRGNNSEATLVSQVGAESLIEEYYFGDPKTCNYTIKVPVAGAAIHVKTQSNSYQCDKAKPIINQVRILPALADSNPVDSFANLSLELADGGMRSDYTSLTRVTLKNFQAYKINPPLSIDSFKDPLPNKDFDFVKVSNVVSERLIKSEFETSAEFEQRKKSQLDKVGESVIVEARVSYDADVQTYTISSYCDDQAEEDLKRDTSFVLKSGTNGFGAKWEWTEHSGKIYKVKWNCSSYEMVRVQIPLEAARSVGDKMVARIKIDIPPQEWTTSRDYSAAEFGKSTSRNLTIYSVTGIIDKVFIGDSSNGQTYYAHSF
jgi:hypothetical protein